MSASRATLSSIPRSPQSIYTHVLTPSMALTHRINDAGNELDCPWRAERKAERGLGAAHELNGDYAHALEHMRKVVSQPLSPYSPHSRD